MTTSNPFPAACITKLGKISDRLIAAELNIPVAAVAAERKRRRIKPARGGPRPKGDAKRSVRIQVLVTADVAARVDVARDTMSRSDWGSSAIESALIHQRDAQEIADLREVVGASDAAIAKQRTAIHELNRVIDELRSNSETPSDPALAE